MVNIVADVLTVKDSDSRPTIEMSIEDINSASDQPTSDTQFSAYTADEFDTAERIEFHLDFLDPNGPNIRIVDGRQATWDSQNDTVSVDLQRSDTARQGQYYFEWVLIYDANVTNLDNATEVNTVPDVGFYGLTVEKPTKRSLVAEDEPDRSVGHIWLGEQSDTPTDSEIGTDNVAFYAKDDGLLYTKPYGGTESQVGSGSGGSPGGSDTQLQYNDGGSFGGISGFTHDDSAGTLTGVPSIDDQLALVDQAASPSANGQIQLNGPDVEVFSGGGVRNLTNVGSASGGSAVEVAEDGTSLTTDVTLIDVLGGLTASEPTTDEIDLTVNESEVDHDSLQNFVANEHIDHSSVSVSGGGTYITGGGDLTANRTLSLSGDTNALDGSQGTDGQVWTSTGTGAQWESASSGGSAVEVQDSAGTSLTADLSLLQFLSGFTATNPTGDEVEVAPDEANIDHDSLQNFVANEHVDHSGVSITAGTALTGGGDITASRTLNVDETAIDHDNLANFVANEHVDYRQDRINSPNAAFQSVELQDSGGENEYTQVTEIVDSTETITVYRWGAYDTSDGSAPSGLDLQLVRGDDTVVVSGNTADTSSTAGVTSYSPSSGTEVVKLRAINRTGTDISSVGGCFGFGVE